MSDREPASRRTTTLWAGIGVMLAATMLAAIELPEVPADAKTSLLIAGAGMSAWLVGRWPALAMCGLCATLEMILQFAQLSLLGMIVRYIVMVGLAWSVSELKQRLTAEYRRGRLDSLTGLPNRQALYERCQSELSRAKRFQRPLTIALLDGDRFKAVNDQRGHAAGDRALQTTAEALRQTIRHYDFVARLGGDEFVVLFPETAAYVAEAAAQRVQRELTKRLQSEFSPLSYSLGVVTFPPGDWDVEECLKQTDRRLYDAKREGTGLIRLGVAEGEFLPTASEAALPNG